MPCIQSDRFLSEDEIQRYLAELKEKHLTVQELQSRLNLPVFKIKSHLRELKRLQYVEEQDGVYSLRQDQPS